MSDPSAALKALAKETKALIVVSEFEARRMPVFQLRSVLQAIVNDDEERKLVIDMVEKDLHAAGHPAEQVMSFLSDLLAAPTAAKALDLGQSVQATRRLRSPFARGFDDAGGTLPAPVTALQPPPAPLAPLTPPGGTAASAASALKSQSQNLPPPDAKFDSTPTRLHLRSSNAPASSLSSSSAPPAAGGAPGHGTSSTATPPTGTPRRNAFAFVSPKPADSTPQAQGSVPVPVGTMAWRMQQAFGNKPGTAGAQAVGGRPMILLADDDKRIRMVFRLRLEEAGMAVFECDNGLEAWERLQKGDVAAAVLDMKMPGLHGLEVLSHMADKGMATPIVVCSAYDQLQDEFVIKTYPHLRYLVKPVAPENLVAALKELLAGKPR